MTASKGLLTAIIAVYTIAFSILSNSYIFIFGDHIFMWGSIILLLLINTFSGIFVLKTKSRRNKILFHGVTLLIAFFAAIVVSVLYHSLLLLGIIQSQTVSALFSGIFSFVWCFVTFWTGIICVYTTSVQLGIKIRVIGIICGFIPIANLIALYIIINKTYYEVLFECGKERLNNKRKNDELCKTKYPILLVHGVFFRDFSHLNYWGRIPKELIVNGANIFYGNHQSAASVKDSAEELSIRIKKIVKETGCEKINIIAHSKGGLDCRCALENSDVASLVASFTTINTPHRGCLFADFLLNIAPDTLKESVSATYNMAAKVLGDANPDFISAVENLTNRFCKAFDSNTPLPSGVFCQSVGSVMRRAGSGKFPLNMSYRFVKYFDGLNDGLVGEEAFEWGEKYTLLDLPVKRGISHGDMIDLNRENIKGFDVREFYVKLVNDLKNRGL